MHGAIHDKASHMKGKRPPLRTLKPRLAPMPPRLKSARTVRDTRYSPDATVRAWYKSARWHKLRQQVLIRDMYTCQQTGVVLAGKSPAPNSPVVDHKIPHRGNEALFFDPENCQSVTKQWHDSTKKRMERSGELA